MSADRVYVVDRIEHRQAVLVDDQGATFTVSTKDLPRGVNEGAVLLVKLEAGGNPRWDTARVDRAETARRHAEAKDRLERLKKRDPGGDIAL
ncbi:MAG TPA: DUF3006 domain-containing protein [Gemmatimonadales bacterium]|nr:DUF3006 domain-containing protein [Gemmatimonadales bacterium]